MPRPRRPARTRSARPNRRPKRSRWMLVTLGMLAIIAIVGVLAFELSRNDDPGLGNPISDFSSPSPSPTPALTPTRTLNIILTPVPTLLVPTRPTPSPIPTPTPVPTPVPTIEVSRVVWECFKDKTQIWHTWEDGNSEWVTCSGYDDEYNDMWVVNKWEQERPIKAWLYGADDYVARAQMWLDHFAQIANLQFVVMPDFDSADFRIFAGVQENDASPNGTGSLAGFFEEYWDISGVWENLGLWEAGRGSCLTGYHQGVDSGEWVGGDVLVPAFYGPTLDEWEARAIDGIIVHEMEHALFCRDHAYRSQEHLFPTIAGYPEGWEDEPVHHPFDIAFIELIAHPDIKSGMTIDEIEPLVIIERDEP